MVVRTLGMLRVAVPLAALASALPALCGTHAVAIGAVVVAPSQCRFGESGSLAPSRVATDAAQDARARTGFRCAGAAASTVSWSLSPVVTGSAGSQLAPEAKATLAGTGALADLHGMLAGNYADSLVLTITP
jgi:hypothetical protein